MTILIIHVNTETVVMGIHQSYVYDEAMYTAIALY